MRLIANLLIIALVVGASSEAMAANSSSNNATNDGSGVSVYAGETNSSGGSVGAPATKGRVEAPRVDYRAQYAMLLHTLRGEQAKEVRRRSIEASVHQGLRATAATCTAQAAYHSARALRRVPVTRRIVVTEHVTERYRVAVRKTIKVRERTRIWVPKTVWKRVPIRVLGRTYHVWRQARVLVREYRWVTRTRTVFVIEWRTRTVPRLTWKDVTTWVTVGSPTSTILARAYGACATHTAGLLAAHEREVAARRSTWEAWWARLNRLAHDAWRSFNTTCRTVSVAGLIHTQECTYAEWRNYAPGRFTRTITVPPTRPPQEIVEEARDRIDVPSLEIGMNPKVEWEQIVHLPTWMWIQPSAWEARTARAEAGSTWARATATPTKVVWDMGNGDRVVCHGPGTPYDLTKHERQQSTDCSYTYRRSSAGRPGEAYRVTATLVYDVEWEGSGGAGGSLGTVTKQATADVRVAELQALNT